METVLDPHGNELTITLDLQEIALFALAAARMAAYLSLDPEIPREAKVFLRDLFRSVANAL